MNTLRVSITTDLFNYSLKPTAEEKLRLFAEFGFEYIHWCDDWNNEVFYPEQDIKRYGQLLDSTGLRCLDVHGTATKNVRIDALEERELKAYIRLLENRIHFCASVGGNAVVIHCPSGKAGSQGLRLGLNRSLWVFEEVKPLCKELGIILALENGSAADVETFGFYFDRYPSEFVAFCFDSGHSHRVGNFDQLIAFGDRLRALHLNDNRGSDDDHQPPFWGTVDWKKVMGWIKESGYSKPLNFEIIHDPRLFKGTMREYMEYLTHAIKEVLKLF